MPYLTEVGGTAVDFLREKSRARIYQHDPEAWLADVLNKRWWSKQAEIANMVVDPSSPQTFTLVKSANGTGKTNLAADLMTWAVSVHDPLEVTVLATANVFSQIKDNAFRYISDNYATAASNGFLLPGRLVGDPAVRFDRQGAGLAKDIIIGRRPSDANLLSSFQGTHDGYVMVILDEAGGLPEDLWIGAYAVTTNEHVAILAIGNPDELNTGFQRRYNDTERYSEWRRATISAYDTPNFTGEVLYPDDPERDRAVKSKMIQPEWADRMKREAHPNVVRAKVYGEFPEEGSTSFFTQHAIETAYNTEIEPPDDAVRVLGVDLSFQGEDETCLYLNVGGRIRRHAGWNKESDYMKQARRVHAEALATGCHVLQLDASGNGGSIYSLLETQEEFQPMPYALIGTMGGRASTDSSRWAQLRAEQYDRFREGMVLGLIDLDPEDSAVRDQMYTQTFHINTRSAIQITPKDQMRSKGLKSPDALDAAIYSFYDAGLMGGQPHPGDIVAYDQDAGLSEYAGFYSDTSRFGW